MKIAVNFVDDKPFGILKKEDRKGCYFISVDDNFDSSKLVKKGYYQQLKDEDGNLLWDETGVGLKPIMGYVVSDEEVEATVRKNLDIWTVKEILNAKYRKQLSENKDYSAVYYEEFLDEENENFYSEINGLNLGKKICFGKGEIVHSLPLKNNKMFFNCEYIGDLPKIEISLNEKTFTKIKSLPFKQDFRKTKYEKIVIKINDLENKISAYSILFNNDSKKDFLSTDYVGRDVLTN